MGDAELFVSRHAAQALVACAASGVVPLRLLLDDGATLGVLAGLGGAAGSGPKARQAAVLQLRVLEMWAEASATGEGQCALLVERGMLAPLLPLLTDGDDPLVRLNVLELLQDMCGTAVHRVALASRLLLPPLHARRMGTARSPHAHIMHTVCTRHTARTHTTRTRTRAA